MIKITNDEFIKRSINKHGYKYDYDKTNYVKMNIKVEIICKKHGIFKQNPQDHLCGNGCPECSGNKKRDLNIFIKEANIVHNNLYCYSKSIYKNNKTKVEIICKEHGSFFQQPLNHINSKQGCPLCFYKKQSGIRNNTLKNLKKNIENWFPNDKYEIDLDSYTNNNSKLKLKCHKHGVFFKGLVSLSRGYGCSLCKGNKSKGEKYIEDYLKSNNIEYIPQKTFDGCKLKSKLKFDFYLPKYNICIEYNGKQHYQSSSKFGGEIEFKLTKKRDIIKYSFCKNNNIPLYIIKYDQNIEKELDIISSKIF